MKHIKRSYKRYSIPYLPGYFESNASREALTTNIPYFETNVLIFYCFHIKTNGRNGGDYLP